MKIIMDKCEDDNQPYIVFMFNSKALIIPGHEIRDFVLTTNIELNKQQCQDLIRFMLYHVEGIGEV